MNRRNFITTAATLAVCSDGLAATAADFDPTEQPIAALQRALTTGTISSEGLLGAYLARIGRFDRNGPGFRAVLALNPDARAAARALDQERRAGKVRGPLHGIPLLIKDNIETADPVPTTAGSWALARSQRPKDAPLVARLRSAGTVILGKANLSEWANFRSTHSLSGWSGIGGQTRNAYARDRNPSGSSAGSAVATAASFCAAAIGTETNGSILSPAALNGLIGLKPTVGTVSGRGIVPISPLQDSAGPMCRTVGDAATLLAVIAEQPLAAPSREGDLETFRLRGLRIGVLPVPGAAHPGAARLFAQTREVFEKEGAVLVDLKVPAALEEMNNRVALLYEFKAAINAYLALLDPAQVEARTLAALIAFNEAHADQELPLFGQELFEEAQERGSLDEPAYLAARTTLQRQADTEGLATLLAQEVDVLLGPGNGPAARIDELWGDRGTGGGSPIASAAAIAGYPSLTAPAGLVAGLPVGVTLVAGRNQEWRLLQVARAYERASGARVPPQLTL